MMPKRVLIIITRRIGDVLLATPLIRSVRRAWPDAKLDVLVFEGTAAMLAANADIDAVISIPERPGLVEHVALLRRLFRNYDLAISALTGDRPTLYAWLAAPFRVGLAANDPRQRWKKWLLSKSVAFDDFNTHTVLMNLKLADAIGIRRDYRLAACWNAADDQRVAALLPEGGEFAVLHPYPKFNYKMWCGDGWAALAQALHSRGLRIVISGGHDAVELAYIDSLLAGLPPATLNLAGQLSLTQTACLLSRAKIYVGPDTATTHIAAAVGAPTVALYGPSNPVKWGPWPRAYADDRNPWRRLGSQRVHNVVLVQSVEPCIPCLCEGCDRHIASSSDCLQNLPAAKVIAAATSLLAAAGADSATRASLSAGRDTDGGSPHAG